MPEARDVRNRTASPHHRSRIANAKSAVMRRSNRLDRWIIEIEQQNQNPYRITEGSALLLA